MLTLIITALFVALGVFRADRAGGNKLDKLQYGASFGLAGFTIGMFLGLMLNIFIA